MFPGAAIEAVDPARDYDLYVAGARLLYGWTSPDIDPALKIEGTEDEELYRSESWGDAENLAYLFKDLPRGRAKVTLRFAEATLGGPGKPIGVPHIGMPYWGAVTPETKPIGIVEGAPTGIPIGIGAMGAWAQ